MTFKPANYADAKETFKPLQRRKRLNSNPAKITLKRATKAKRLSTQGEGNLAKRGLIGLNWGTFKRRSRLNPRGRKVKAWESARRKLKIRFAAMGIMSCELRYPGCWFDNGLGFAHAAKRVKLKGDDLYHVILACNPCHDKIEFLPAEEMKRIVDNVIQARPKSP